MNKLLSILVLILLCGTAAAQTARQLFNPAAREYILGNTPVASNLVVNALAKYPDDEKLQKLKELIEQQEEQNDQKNQDQQNQDQDQQDQQDPQDPDDQNQPDQKDQQDPEPDDEPQDQQAPPAPQQPAGEMNKEEAEQLLDAMKQNEKDQRSDLRPHLGPAVRVNKDW